MTAPILCAFTDVRVERCPCGRHPESIQARGPVAPLGGGQKVGVVMGNQLWTFHTLDCPHFTRLDGDDRDTWEMETARFLLRSARYSTRVCRSCSPGLKDNETSRRLHNN